MDFEKSMSRLAEIAALMNSSELPLEESVKLYTEAVRLTKECREYIQKAQLKIEQLEAAE